MIAGNEMQDFCATDANDLEEPTLQDKLLAVGLLPEVADKIIEMTSQGVLDEKEIDSHSLELVKEVGQDALSCLQEVATQSNLTPVKNRVAYMCGMLKSIQMRSGPVIQPAPESTTIPAPVSAPTVIVPPPPPAPAQNRIKGPDNEKIEALKTRLGFPLEITSGQRHLGPSPDWSGPIPSNEVFIGHLPYDVFEDELIPIFEVFGTIYDSRIMLDPTGQFCAPPGHKGFAFINFTERSAAEEAIKKMNGSQIRGKKVKVSPSYQNKRLFIGNLPKNKSKEEILEEVRKVTEGCLDVIVYADINDARIKNRGFAFADYDYHKNASAARRRLGQGQAVLFGRAVVADWAEPITEPDEEIMAKVKVLYVKNLKEEVTEEQLQQKAAEFGAVEKCKKIKDYAFLTYRDRASAVKALEALHGFMMGGVALDVTLARPQLEEQKKAKEMRRAQFDPMGRGMPHAMSYGYSGWSDPVIVGPGMASSGRARGSSRGQRGTARGGAKAGRGVPPPLYDPYYQAVPARPPPPSHQTWGSSNGATYSAYGGAYNASVPGSEYYSSYDGYSQPTAGHTADDYVGGYAAPYRSGYPPETAQSGYEYGHSAMPTPPPLYAGNGGYGAAPKSQAVARGRGKGFSNRGAGRGGRGAVGKGAGDS